MNKLLPLAVSLFLIGAPLPAFAVDTEAPARPELNPIRAKVEARDFKGAIADLTGLVESGSRDPDVYNLLGYSLRQSGEREAALSYYQKALDFDPDHKGALEYLGELYVQMGDIAKAEGNEARLKQLCPQGCEELADLTEAIAAARQKTN